MGGNAFENTRRLSEEEYARICERYAQHAVSQKSFFLNNINLNFDERISEILSRLGGMEWRFPPEIADKAEVVMGEHFLRGKYFCWPQWRLMFPYCYLSKKKEKTLFVRSRSFELCDLGERVRSKIDYGLMEVRHAEI